jgi:hypothetical protein
MDSFEWCNDFSRQHYNKFLQRKKQMAGAKAPTFLPHEPVGFFQAPAQSNLAVCKLETPLRAKYVTLKISTLADHMGLTLEHISLKALHAAHPLGAIIGTPAAAAKIKEIVMQLRAGASWGEEKKDEKQADPMSSAGSKAADGKELVVSGGGSAGTPNTKGWRLDQDEALVALLQMLASRLGVSPMAFDAIMLQPSEDDLARFKTVAPVPLDAMRARVAVLKYMNRLVTPLLFFVDVSVFEDEARYYR